MKMKLVNYRSHSTGQTWLTPLTPQMVAAAPDPTWAFAQYLQQTLGVMWPTQGDINILRKKVNEFFDRYPQADFFTLCRVAVWCKGAGSARGRYRFERVWQIMDIPVRKAWAARVIPELDGRRVDESLEDGITRALESELDPSWRSRLIGTTGAEFRRNMLDEWRLCNET